MNLITRLRKIIKIFVILLFVFINSKYVSAEEIDLNGEYNAYLGIQTPNWTYRNSWNDINGIGSDKWGDFIYANETGEKIGKVTDTVIKGNGVYSVKLTDFGSAIAEDFTTARSQEFNLLFISTDIPLSEKIRITDVKIIMDGKTIKIYDEAFIDPDEQEYFKIIIVNIWNSDINELPYYAAPIKSVEMQFTISGFNYNNGENSDIHNAIVPNLYELTEDEAVSKLTNAGLKYVIATSKSDKVKKGLVMEQSVEADTIVSKGTTVIITISEGGNDFEIPDVVGMTYNDALQILSGEYGFVVAPIYELNDEYNKGIVFKSNPEAPIRLKNGDKITVYVSLGEDELAVVPNVVSKTEEGARKELEEKGFEVKIEEEYSETVSKGRVISMDVDAKTRLPKGETITITISLGKKSEETVKLDGENKDNNDNKYIDLLLTTDKNKYEVGDNITVSCTLTNVYVNDLQDIKLKISVPDGYVVKDGKNNSITLDLLNAGDTYEFKTEYVIEKAEKSFFKSVIPFVVIGVVIYAAVVVVVLIIISKNKKKKLGAGVYILLILCGLSSFSVSANQDKEILCDTIKVIQIDGEDVEIKATVEFNVNDSDVFDSVETEENSNSSLLGNIEKSREAKDLQCLDTLFLYVQQAIQSSVVQDEIERYGGIEVYLEDLLEWKSDYSYLSEEMVMFYDTVPELDSKCCKDRKIKIIINESLYVLVYVEGKDGEIVTSNYTKNSEDEYIKMKVGELK